MMGSTWRSWCVLAAGAMACTAALALPSFEQVKARYRSSDAVLLDRHGEPVQQLRADTRAQRSDWVPLAQVSPAFRQALLFSEDKRFYEHGGVDWSSVGAAAWANLWNTRTRGASTVTMQLAGLLDAELATPKGGRSLSAKVGQVSTAWQLERQWRKDQILEAYVNLVGFRGELVGIGAMSARLFQKYPSGLNAQEAAIAAALVRAPNAKPLAVSSRACGILTAQGRAKACVFLSTYTEQVLASRPAERLDADRQIAPHLARRLLALNAATASAAKPVSLKSTLDARLQRFTRDTLRQHLAGLQERHVEDGAVIVIDNASGDVLAWVGSSGGGLSQAAEVDGVMALRQAGSTLKPFLYEMAMEQRWMTAASILHDSPVDLSTPGGLYIPQNYDRHFKGPVSVRTALAASLNVPAVRTLVMVTPERFAQRLKALGLPLKRNGDYYGYSLALGSAEVTLADLSNAYRSLANGGVHTPLRMRATDPALAPKAVMDSGASFIVSDILADREARVPTFGLDNALAARYWVAAKTGTSKDMRDNWCIGFSKRYTVGVWVGNASGEPMWDVSGVSGAAPVWRTVMDELERRAGPLLPQASGAPASVVQTAVSFDRQLEPPRQEWFLEGTQQSHIQLASLSGSARSLITAPADRTVIALDPDIPPRSQRLTLSAAPGVPSQWAWRLDGKRLGPAKPMLWTMWPGRHHLALIDAQGQTMAEVKFEVRGAGLKPDKPGQRLAASSRQVRPQSPGTF
ncbi:penicillin-binding protein 1C [Aquabacterium sp. CECT 9606]|uniref:penicillin-binding protein 1C n=1 Tax=Aquabacterium sp. CECT 9606 TaxID=2845822 RepID=UPI00352FF11D